MQEQLETISSNFENILMDVFETEWKHLNPTLNVIDTRLNPLSANPTK